MNGGRSGLGRAAWVVAAAAALSTLITIATPHVIRGRRFGRLVERFLPETRGAMHVGGGSWTWAAAWALWREHPAPLVLEDVSISDPEGTEVFRARRLVGQVEIHRDRSEIVIHDLEVTGAAWLFTRMKKKGGSEIGFLAAFEPRPKARAPSAGASRAAPPTTTTSGGGGRVAFGIEAARIDGLDVSFDLPDWSLLLADVRTTGSLSFRQERGHPPSFSFEVRDADARRGGRLRILAPSKHVELPFARARLARVASSGDSTNDAAHDSIFLSASGITTGRSVSSLRGTFVGVLGSARPGRRPGIDLRVGIDMAADAVGAIVARQKLGAQVEVDGPAARLGMSFSGPFEDVVMSADASNFVLRKGELEAREIGLHVSAHLGTGRLQLKGLTLASPAGGRLGLDADLDPPRISAVLKLDRLRFPRGRRLPLYLLPLAGATLDGVVRARLDPATGSASFDAVAVSLTRPEGSSGPRVLAVRSGEPARKGTADERWLKISGLRFADGALQVTEVTTPAWGGSLAARGRVVFWDREHGRWMPSPLFDLSLRADGISFAELVGPSLAAGKIFARGRARGPIDDLDLRVAFQPHQRVRILAEWFELPTAVTLHLDGQGLVIPAIRLDGAHGNTLGATGRIGLGGDLDIAVTVQEFPFAKLPALAKTDLPFGGRLSGEVRLAGDNQRPSVSGRFSIEGTTFQGRPIGGGSLAIATTPDGGIRVRGQVIDGVLIDGTLVPQAAGLAGDASLEVRQLRLDPFLVPLLAFLPGLPRGATAAGSLSGTAEIRMPAGAQPVVEGHLSALAITLAGPAVAARGAQARSQADSIDLRSEGRIDLSLALGRGGSSHIGPIRLVGAGSSLELSAENKADAWQGTMRGRLRLGAVARLVAPELAGATGSVDVDVDVSGAAAARGALPIVKGRIAVAETITLEPARPVAVGTAGKGAGKPVGKAAGKTAEKAATSTTVRITAGALEIDGEAVRLRALDVSVGSKLHALIGGGPGSGGMGTLQLASSGARGIEIAGVDLPVRGTVSALVAPTATIDAASFALRLEGDPRRRLRLSGDVEVVKAHARPYQAANRNVDMDLGKTTGGSGKLSSWLARPEIGATQLDVRVQARSGAVAVEVPHVPDLKVNIDFRIRGTAKHPEPSGSVHGANVYSSFMMLIQRLIP